MSQERPVSPVGTSKFEQEYQPPSRRAAPRSPASSHTFESRRHGIHVTKPSQASTVDSLLSYDNNAYSTAPTSINNSPTDGPLQALPKLPSSMQTSRHNHPEAYPENNLQLVDTEEWSSRFHSHADQYEPITDECPDRASLAAAYNIPIYSADGTPIPFGQLFHPATAAHTRQLIIFIRHFYCGACQAYLKAISDNITMQEYFSIPTPTSIFVIGCGHPELIPFYKLKTGCPFPIYAEPSRALFKRLGMVLSVNMGIKRPEYMEDISFMSWMAGQLTTIRRGIKLRQTELNKTKLEASERRRRQAELDRETAEADAMEANAESGSMTPSSIGDGRRGEDKLAIRKRDIIKGGNLFQIGGEFLFNDGDVVWCHRMKNYRDHAEINVIRRVLELDD
ncbi:hypothetical protein Q7P37_001964 [Cladosporium fusiforme]